jgi:hypothetical protein
MEGRSGTLRPTGGLCPAMNSSEKGMFVKCQTQTDNANDSKYIY